MAHQPEPWAQTVDTNPHPVDSGIMKTKDVRNHLLGYFDSASQKEGVFTVRRSYFYTNGLTAEKCEAIVKSRIPAAQIIESGNKWTTFRGGASVAQGSHFWVKFKIADPLRVVDVA